MFSKFIVVSALAILAVATPAPNTAPAGGAGCGTGPVQCCQQVVSAKSAAATNIIDAIGIVIEDINALVGLTCSPITGVGIGTGNAWCVVRLVGVP